jgi:hypothetical protein
MNGVSSALYIDFDNVFSGLLAHDPVAARAFAEQPGSWLSRLSERMGSPRWLHLRCYLNAGGAAKHPDPAEPKVPFLPFRKHFARAGFEIVDCPPLTPQSKNAADIRLAVDVMDVLHGPVSVLQFVIFSSDSDFTPLLQRLRAAERATALVTTFAASDALTAAARRHIDREAMIDLLRPPAPAPVLRSAPSVTPALHPDWSTFSKAARRAYRQSTGPVQLSALGTSLRKELDGHMTASGWFGHASLSKALQALELDGLEVSSHHVWDSTRHKAPKEPRTA